MQYPRQTCSEAKSRSARSSASEAASATRASSTSTCAQFITRIRHTNHHTFTTGITRITHIYHTSYDLYDPLVQNLSLGGGSKIGKPAGRRGRGRRAPLPQKRVPLPRTRTYHTNCHIFTRRITRITHICNTNYDRYDPLV